MLVAEQAILRAKLLLAQGRGSAFLEQASERPAAEAPSGSAGEYAGLVAIAAAAAGDEERRAAEAAAAQGAFWPMHDALFADQGRLEDPHLWARAEKLGLDVARFDADRRSPDVAARVTADFRGGVRGGVATTPTVFVDGRAFPGRPTPELWRALGAR